MIRKIPLQFFIISIIAGTILTGCENGRYPDNNLVLNDSGYFETTGINYLVFSNWYNGMFSDSKMSGIEIIHHGVRTATNGDVRLESTPEQWDAIPTFIERKVNVDEQSIEAVLSYPDFNFQYTIQANSRGKSMVIRVRLDEPLPEALAGKAGFNLEFLPSAYFTKKFTVDQQAYSFPLHPEGPVKRSSEGEVQPLPLASGRQLVLAPEDPERRVTVKSLKGELGIYDGRNVAQNGWFVVRSLIPEGESGDVIEWIIEANSMDGWTREPVIGHSQVGYHPAQKKIAVIELDPSITVNREASLFRISEDGTYQLAFQSGTIPWGQYVRYNYVYFDFSDVEEEGIYVIDYDGFRTRPFLIGQDVFSLAWQPTLDVFFPVQMDHMLVNEAYRVWHGAGHLDDARQAPINHEHFDLYAQGPTTDTPYRPGDHIPGLNIGGWCDAGDYDIRTQSQYATVLGLVNVWEEFSIQRDQTTIDQESRFADIHVPDGTPDVLQQIEHGVLALLAQHRAVGHAIPGIIVPDISQYTHLGDAQTMTDNRVHIPGAQDSKPDDRWAFTSRSTPLNYGSAAALAAASRALAGSDPELAAECIARAEHVWDEEQNREPDIFRVGNTTGGRLDFEELRAAVELLITTKNPAYRERILQLMPVIESWFSPNAVLAVRILPHMGDEYREQLEQLTISYKQKIDSIYLENPYGVAISRGGWAGSGRIIRSAVTHYYLHKAFPEIIPPEDILKGLNYLFGCHPGSDISFVSGVGTESKKVAYGFNRADYSFIAGGIVPGVLILPPDFPENKEDWPFLWGENEYVITLGASYIFAVNAANTVLNGKSSN